MGMLAKFIQIGAPKWPSPSTLGFHGSCVNNPMLLNQWYFLCFIISFYLFFYFFFFLEAHNFLFFLIECQINTCNGWYCHDFEPNNPNSPKMWTENWVGWQVFKYLFYVVNFLFFIKFCLGFNFHVFLLLNVFCNQLLFLCEGSRIGVGEIHIELRKMLPILLQGFFKPEAHFKTTIW